MNGKVISGPAAILVLLLFFLPWVAVSCGGIAMSEFSGYQLAVGTEFDGDPIFFVIPLAAIISLVLLGSTLWKPSLETNANWGLIIASVIGLLIFILKWLQLRSQNDVMVEIVILPALWVTMIALLSIGLGAVFDLVSASKHQPLRSASVYGSSQPKEKPYYPTLITPRSPQPPPGKASYETWVDEGYPKNDPQATLVDDDYELSAVQSKQTILDESVKEQRSTFSSLNKDLDDSDATHTADEAYFKGGDDVYREETQYNEPDYPVAQKKPAVNPFGRIDKTEVLHIKSESMAWLVIGNGERKGEQFRLLADTTIGRDPNNDIVLNDSALSALHVRVRLESGSFIAYDENSTNGLFTFNAQQNRWEKIDRVLLQEGTRLKLGRTVLHFITLNLDN